MHPSVTVSRRRFLRLSASYGLGLCALGACSDEFTDPEWKLWIAKSIRGTVFRGGSLVPIPGASIVFRAGLEPRKLVHIATVRSGDAGRYGIVASETLGGVAGYWRFLIDSSSFSNSTDDIPIYLQLEARANGLEYVDWNILRRPQKTLPPESEAFHLLKNVVID